MCCHVQVNSKFTKCQCNVGVKSNYTSSALKFLFHQLSIETNNNQWRKSVSALVNQALFIVNCRQSLDLNYYAPNANGSGCIINYMNVIFLRHTVKTANKHIFSKFFEDFITLILYLEEHFQRVFPIFSMLNFLRKLICQSTFQPT